LADRTDVKGLCGSGHRQPSKSKSGAITGNPWTLCTADCSDFWLQLGKMRGGFAKKFHCATAQHIDTKRVHWPVLPIFFFFEDSPSFCGSNYWLLFTLHCSVYTATLPACDSLHCYFPISAGVVHKFHISSLQSTCNFVYISERRMRLVQGGR
jgi:hypothetical protein